MATNAPQKLSRSDFIISYFSKKDKKFISRIGKWGEKSRIYISKSGKKCFTYYQLNDGEAKEGYRTATGSWRLELTKFGKKLIIECTEIANEQPELLKKQRKLVIAELLSVREKHSLQWNEMIWIGFLEISIGFLEIWIGFLEIWIGFLEIWIWLFGDFDWLILAFSSRHNLNQLVVSPIIHHFRVIPTPPLPSPPTREVEVSRTNSNTCSEGTKKFSPTNSFGSNLVFEPPSRSVGLLHLSFHLPLGVGSSLSTIHYSHP